MSFVENKINTGKGASKGHGGQTGDYFQEATSWNYERYQIQQVISNRWQLAFWIQLFFGLCLVFLIVALLPLKTWEPIVVYRNEQTGEVRVESSDLQHLPVNHEEVESDLVRYVTARETFTFADNNDRYQSVIFKSSPMVAQEYNHTNDNNNPDALIHKLGHEGMRTVKVEDVVFLDAGKESGDKGKNAQPDHLARVNFVTTETVGQTVVKQKWVATMRWEYLGAPKNKKAAWVNWNGFAVTYYRVDQRNV
jgi:type IV secretory pathway component VirB8